MSDIQTEEKIETPVQPQEPVDKVSRAFLSNPLDLPEQKTTKGHDLYAAKDIPDLIRKAELRKQQESGEKNTPEFEEDVEEEVEVKEEVKKPKEKTFKDAFADEDLSTPLYEREREETEKPLWEEDEKTFVESQSFEDKEVLEVLRWGESKDESLKGSSEEYINFLKKHAQYTSSDSFDPDGYEYEEWLKENRPKVDPNRFKKLQRDFIIEEATKRAKNELKEEQKKLKRKVEEVEKKPQLEAQLNKFSETLFHHLPEEIQNTLREHGIEEGQKKLVAEYPVHASITHRELVDVENQGRALIEISRGAADYDSNNPVHEALGNKIIEFGKQMLSHPKGDQVLIRDGKRFVPRERFGQLSPEERAKSWTFSPNEILALLGQDMKVKIDRGIKQGLKEQEELEQRILAKHGYAKKSAPSASQHAETHPSTVKTRSAPVPPPSRGVTRSSNPLKDFMTKPIEL